MQLMEVLISNNTINIESAEWQRVIKQIHIQMTLDIDKLDCYKCLECKFCLKANRSTTKISERSGYFISAKQGLLVICPSTTDLPITMFIDKKQIRVVEHETKFLKGEVNVKTNEDTYCFRGGKKQVAELEKEVNRVRLG